MNKDAPKWSPSWVEPEPSRIATPEEFAYLQNFGPNPANPGAEPVKRHVMMAEADRLAEISG